MAPFGFIAITRASCSEGGITMRTDRMGYMRITFLHKQFSN